MDTLLYVDCEAGSRVVAMKLAGVRRYAEAQGWKVVVLMEPQSRPARLRRALLRERMTVLKVAKEGGTGYLRDLSCNYPEPNEPQSVHEKYRVRSR